MTACMAWSETLGSGQGRRLCLSALDQTSKPDRRVGAVVHRW